jgi:hypothetical protein
MKITTDMELKDIPEEELAKYENQTPFFERSEIVSVLGQYKIELKKIKGKDNKIIFIQEKLYEIDILKKQYEKEENKYKLTELYNKSAVLQKLESEL